MNAMDRNQIAQQERQQDTMRKKQSMKNPYDLGFAPQEESEWFGVDCNFPSKGKQKYTGAKVEEIEKDKEKKK